MGESGRDFSKILNRISKCSRPIRLIQRWRSAARVSRPNLGLRTFNIALLRLAEIKRMRFWPDDIDEVNIIRQERYGEKSTSRAVRGMAFLLSGGGGGGILIIAEAVVYRGGISPGVSR